jgi:hypothetical protein
MGEHVVSSMVIAPAPDIAMEDRHAVRAAVRGVAIKIVVEDRSDGAIGPCADVERPGRGCFHPLRAEGFDQPNNAEAGPEALFRMRPFFQDQIAQCCGRWPDRGRVATDALDGQSA